MKLISKTGGLFLLCLMISFSCFAQEKQLVVRKINFEGATHFTNKQLLSFMDTSPKFLFWGGKLTDTVIDYDIEQIRKAYREDGFLNVEITYEKIYKSARNIILHIKIREGSGQQEVVDLTLLSNADLVERLKERESSINFLTEYFEKIKQEKENTALKLQASVLENGNLKAAITKDSIAKKQLEQKVIRLKSDLVAKEKSNTLLKDKLNSISKIFDEKIAAINNAKDILTSTVDEINFAVKQELDAIELAPIVASENKDTLEIKELSSVIEPTIETKAVDIKTGKVILVKKQLNFVIANLGVNDGIETGMLFNVNRGDAVLASVKVIEVRKKVSALEILEQQEGSILQEGDIVRYLGAQIAIS